MTNTHRESVNDISQQEETRQKWNAIVKNEETFLNELSSKDLYDHNIHLKQKFLKYNQLFKKNKKFTTINERYINKCIPNDLISNEKLKISKINISKSKDDIFKKYKFFNN